METEMNWSDQMTDLIPKSMDEIRFNYEHRDTLRGLDTGFRDLNAMTSGLRPGTLTIIGGRPSMGKTIFALNIVRHVALNNNCPALIMSYEESREQISQRLLVHGAQLDANRLRCGYMSEADWDNLDIEAERLKLAPLVVEDHPLTVAEIHTNCRQLIESGFDLKLLLLDYIQLMPFIEANSGENKITLTRQLKRMAVDLNIAVIANSQLSRALESRKNKRPKLADLRECAIDGDAADLILFLYRDEYYDPESIQRGEAEIIIVKQRHGPVGTIELLYKSSTGAFSNKYYSD